MGSSTFSKHDLEMIEISWAFVRDKQLLGSKTMIRIFETSSEIKKLFGFASSLESVNNMMKNTCVHYHASQVIKKLTKIIILLTKSFSLNEDEKDELIDLGERHYHFGLKMEYFLVFFFFNLFYFNFILL
jgi:hypothetical protein